MKKFLSLLLSTLVLTLAFSNLAFALDLEPSTQAITKQSDEEIKLGREKEKDAKVLIKALDDLKAKKITKNGFDKIVDNYKSKYARQSSANNSLTASMLLTYGVLNLPAYGQDTPYYCGPASAYNMLNWLGITSYNGRSLTQANLANDLGTTTDGTPFSGTWALTLKNWSDGYNYIARWASNSGTLTQWKGDLYSFTKCDVYSSWPGVVYDTHQKPSDTVNRLPGYESISKDVWHYVAGDGYDETDPSARKVHYSDSNKYRTGAWGSHWTTVHIMGTITWDRGMVW